VPGARRAAAQVREWLGPSSSGNAFHPGFPPGHFYSPIPSLLEIREREQEIFGCGASPPRLEMHEAEQLQLISELAPLCRDQPFGPQQRQGRRYYFDNDLFGYGDALILHALLRRTRPSRLVEVGCGFSSAVTLDTSDLFLGGQLSCTFIDPFPEQLNALMREGDVERHRVLSHPVQRVELAVFDELDSGDILFVDSTHVSKVGSDVNFIVFEVLPRLRPGVLVHFHDIFYPFEYPRDWFYEGRAWNEAYLLRAFLMFNASFDILLFNSYLDQFHRKEMTRLIPLWAPTTTSLWLTRNEE